DLILVGVSEMGQLEALLIACLSSLTQCLPRDRRKFNWLQISFNVCAMAVAVQATGLIYRASFLSDQVASRPLRLAIACAAYFLVNTITMAIVLSLTENKNVGRAWLAMFQLSFQYRWPSAGVAGVVLTRAARVGWQAPVLVLPLMAGFFYSYRRYFALPPRLSAEMSQGKMGAEGVRQQEQQAHG